MLAWLISFGTLVQVGVEDTDAYGAALSRFLHSERVAVVEVDRPDRKTRRAKGKSGPIDAYAAARAALSGRAAGTPKTRSCRGGYRSYLADVLQRLLCVAPALSITVSCSKGAGATESRSS